MSERAQAIARTLSRAPWRDWRAEPITGDASARIYTRLIGPEDSVVVMDADPAQDSGTPAFVKIARYLASRDLAAPKILMEDLDLGLVVMTDLGRDRIAEAVSRTPELEAEVYDAATDVLVALDGLAPPPLAAMTPQVAGEMVAITAERYARCDPGPLCAAVTQSFAGLTPDRIALRDVHAENLVWRPDRHGLDRVGLLDFQDAFLAPRGYDLASLLSDIRRDVPASVRAREIGRFARATGQDESDLNRALATLGAQRNLRILGVFSRLIANGKDHYAALMPRVWTTLMRDLSHPELSDLRAVVLRDLPPVAP
ncbi:hypothetical protein EU805_02345 [Salipiger sp. IMCC34102]|uniref:aminoglycoside phosphotransferase family protein n=1 Tax=Salipiger sp. IMCC34102 TaxID=2510647 RepID=UPI00101BEDA7|nr:phosphotransferase [Salipiger sp. IMCC34102]RYH04234.1 hypothetical protein EU805_02345 [Salipiger sp. IMCC34102]